MKKLVKQKVIVKNMTRNKVVIDGCEITALFVLNVRVVIFVKDFEAFKHCSEKLFSL